MSTGTGTGTARLGDLDVAYRVAGSGDAVVLVHGLAEDHRTWAAQQDALVDHRTYAYDLRGHGRTTIGDADETLAQLGGDLVVFLERVSGPATCVGFSLGGTVVLWAAAHRPDLVRRAVVLGTSTVVGRAAVGFYDDRIATARRGDRAGLAANLRDDTRAGLGRRTDRLDEVTAARVAAVGDAAGYVNAAAAMRTLREAPLTPLLADVAVPVDVVGGECDTFCPRKAADIVLQALPDARYHEIPGVGHLMNVDDPAAVTAVLESVLPEGKHT